AGDDTINGGAGNDTMVGSSGDDTFAVTDGWGTDTIAGNETLETSGDTLDLSGVTTNLTVNLTSANNESGSFTDGTSTATFSEIETFDLGAGSDVVDASAANTAVTVYGGAGADVVTGSTAGDVIYGGFDGDTIIGGAGADTMDGGSGDDWFIIDDGFGNDTVTPGETGELSGDYLLGAGLTGDVTLDLSAGNPADGEDGTLAMGGDTITFSEIEIAVLGSGNDTVIGSSGNDMVATGEDADTVIGGAGDDIFDLGNFDGASDVVVLQDGFDNDTVYSFEAPTPNGDGTFTGTDTLDVTQLHDANGNPVHTSHVDVTDDGMGNAVLTFPNGESITLVGISAAEASDPLYLNAIGIPLSDGTIEGTAGSDIIDASYTGDPDGDMVDGDDAILAGDTGNDDLIYGFDGNDSIYAGNGNDEVYGGTGNDLLQTGLGDDIVYAAMATTVSMQRMVKTLSTAALATMLSEPPSATTSSMAAMVTTQSTAAATALRATRSLAMLVTIPSAATLAMTRYKAARTTIF
ncbi:MAG: calcium-binding protein, partial [Yoonia sp.]|nr:calcium-binding protein [Yoonia sp.]